MQLTFTVAVNHQSRSLKLGASKAQLRCSYNNEYTSTLDFSDYNISAVLPSEYEGYADGGALSFIITRFTDDSYETAIHSVNNVYCTNAC